MFESSRSDVIGCILLCPFDDRSFVRDSRIKDGIFPLFEVVKHFAVLGLFFAMLLPEVFLVVLGGDEHCYVMSVVLKCDGLSF